MRTKERAVRFDRTARSYSMFRRHSAQPPDPPDRDRAATPAPDAEPRLEPARAATPPERDAPLDRVGAARDDEPEPADEPARAAAPPLDLAGGLTRVGVELRGTARAAAPPLDLAGGLTRVGVELRGTARAAAPPLDLAGGLTRVSVELRGTARAAAPPFDLVGGLTRVSVELRGTARAEPDEPLDGTAREGACDVDGTVRDEMPDDDRVRAGGATTSDARVDGTARVFGFDERVAIPERVVAPDLDVAGGLVVVAAPGKACCRIVVDRSGDRVETPLLVLASGTMRVSAFDWPMPRRTAPDSERDGVASVPDRTTALRSGRCTPVFCGVLVTTGARDGCACCRIR
jgi:hypothetical protein